MTARSVQLRGPHTKVWSLYGLEGDLVAGAFGNCGYDADGEEAERGGWLCCCLQLAVRGASEDIHGSCF